MTKTERAALRRSILQGVRGAVHETLIRDDLYEKDVWCGVNRDWEGPEVEEDCKIIWHDFMDWMRERLDTVRNARKREES